MRCGPEVLDEVVGGWLHGRWAVTKFPESRVCKQGQLEQHHNRLAPAGAGLACATMGAFCDVTVGKSRRDLGQDRRSWT